VEKPTREAKPRVKAKADPQMVAAARELRDRWLEHIITTPLIGRAKYDVTRGIVGDGENSGGRVMVASNAQQAILPAA
jgi:hypothetical protein